MSPILLRHSKINLALHAVQSGDGSSLATLLLLHGLGERSSSVAPDWLGTLWPGPVYALDFTGHGDSTVPIGGGYSAELLMADVDAVLAHLGPVSIVGRGLGAYVALLSAGARPDLVRGVVLADGPGLSGGSTGPTSAVILCPSEDRTTSPDPWALVELSHDVRPRDYALTFATKAFEHSGLAEPIIVSARNRPPWVAAVINEPGVPTVSLSDAVTRLAQQRKIDDR